MKLTRAKLSARAKVTLCNSVFIKFYPLVQKCLRVVFCPRSILYTPANLTATHLNILQ